MRSILAIIKTLRRSKMIEAEEIAKEHQIKQEKETLEEKIMDDKDELDITAINVETTETEEVTEEKNKNADEQANIEIPEVIGQAREVTAEDASSPETSAKLPQGDGAEEDVLLINSAPSTCHEMDAQSQQTKMSDVKEGSARYHELEKPRAKSFLCRCMCCFNQER